MSDISRHEDERPFSKARHLMDDLNAARAEALHASGNSENLLESLREMLTIARGLIVSLQLDRVLPGDAARRADQIKRAEERMKAIEARLTR